MPFSPLRTGQLSSFQVLNHATRVARRAAVGIGGGLLTGFELARSDWTGA